VWKRLGLDVWKKFKNIIKSLKILIQEANTDKEYFTMKWMFILGRGRKFENTCEWS